MMNQVNSDGGCAMMPAWSVNIVSWIQLILTCVCVCVRWTTTIRLPLKSEMKQLAASRTLAARFRDIQPSLLLFLHRLRSITVYNQVLVCDSFAVQSQAG